MNRPAATASQMVSSTVGQLPNCSINDGPDDSTCASSIASPATGWNKGCTGAPEGTVRSTVCVSVGISSRAAGISHSP